MKERLEEDWALALKRGLRPPCVVVAIGNGLRGDDGIGPTIVGRLRERCGFPCFDGGLAPENLTGLLCQARPRTILLIDAVDCGAPPGRIRLFAGRELAEIGFCTHAMSPRLLCAYLQGRTGAAVLLLGIQPERCGLDEVMSPPCCRSAAVVAQTIAAISAQVG